MAIPADIRDIWGDPPLLRNEDPEIYEKLAGQIRQAVRPIDVIEWLWVKDVALLHSSDYQQHATKAVMALARLPRDRQAQPEEYGTTCASRPMKVFG